MPRRKQGHSQASKRIANSAERLHGKGLVKKRTSNDVKPTTSSRTSMRKGGRGGSRARTVVLKASRLANENATAVPDVRTRYLHKKFQRVGCLSPTPSLDSNIRAESDEALQKGKAYPELRCTDNQNCSKSSTMALEALLQVTELEINKSSAKDVTLSKSKDVSQTAVSMIEVHSTTCVEKSSFADSPHTSSSTQNTESCRPLVRRSENLNSSPRQPIDSVEVVQSSILPFTTQENEPKKSKVCRHVCPYCCHGFAKPSVLKKHIRAHTNERPYPCRLCGFSFKTKSNLYKHCKSRAHVLKVNECGSTGADPLPADAAHSNSDTEDEVEQLSVSENSCDTSSVNSSSLPPEISSVPKPSKEESKERISSHIDALSKSSKSNADDQQNITNRPRVPPIKIQTLLQNRQVASKRSASLMVSDQLSSAAPLELNSDSDKSKTPVSLCSIENNDISSSAHCTSKSPVSYTVLSPTSQPSTLSAPCVPAAINSPPPGKNTSGVSSLIYKPKFHSAIIGGSRKFIDHKNFTLDLSQEESSSTSSCCVPSHDDGSIDVQHEDNINLAKECQGSHSYVASNNDGLMLRVLEGKSNISEQQLETTLVSNSSDTLKSLPSTIASETNSVVSEQQQYLHSSSTSTASSLKTTEKTIVCTSTATSVGRGSGLSLQVTNKTPIKSPRLVSPELVKQHISNLISANTAIVETLNPLWSRRFLRQSSVASSQNVDAELRARNKHRRYGNYGGGEDLSQSKLANALLRKGGVGLQLTGSQSLPATPSIILTSPPFANVLLAEVKTQLLNIEAARTSPLPNPVPGKDCAAVFCESSTSLVESSSTAEKASSNPGNVAGSLVLSTIADGVSDPANSESSANEEKSGQSEIGPGSLQHPQNPEGSIIKNLLLTKRRSPSITALPAGPTASPVHYINSHILTPGEIVPNLDRTTAQIATESYSYQFHTCPVCHTSFRSMETLQAHQSHYCPKVQRLSPAAYVREGEIASVMRVQCETSQFSKGRGTATGDVPSKPRGRPKGSKNRPKELLVIPANPSLSQSSSSPYLPPSPLTPSYGHISGLTSPLLSSDAHGKTLSALKGKLNFRQGNDVPELSTTDKPVFDPQSKQMVSPYSSETSNADGSEEGAILKKHLLLGGLCGDKSPPLKKRRIPDETVKNNTEPGSTQNSVSTLRSLEELSRYPMRSNSVQLFGGEVEICDSGETKKMRIDAKLQHPVPSGGGLVLGTSSPALSLQMMPVLGSRCPPSATCTVDGGLPSPSVVVTIAKLVLNSGGTMMQVQESKSHSTPPVCIPVVALGHPHTSSEMATASDRGSSPMAAFSEGSLSSSKFSEVGAVILSPSITTVQPDKVAGIHSIDISHLQLCSTTTLSYSSPSSPLVVGHNPSSLLPHNQFAISRMTPSPSAIYSPGKRRLSPAPLVNTSGGATITMPSSLPPLVVVTGSSDSTARTFLPSVVSSIISLRSSPSIYHSSKEDFTVRSAVAENPSDQTKLINIQSSQSHEESTNAITESRILNNAAIPIIQIDSAAPSLQPNVSSTISTTTTPPSAAAVSSFSASGKQPGKAFLAPPRPTSLPLKSSHSSMVGTTLISPETPRPKKKYGQLYINGQYYTYLGLKCSTRVYYCCIYRPQPMYVPQSTDPKLSMYSNWQTVPVNPDKINLTPAAAMACYDSRHRSNRYAIAGPKKLEYLLTHSSYWTFKQQKSSEKDVPKAKDLETVDVKPEENTLTIELSEEAPLSKSDITVIKEESQIPTTAEETVGNETCPSSVKQKRPESSETRREPKRVKIFEGGFKSNEEYTYVRGRGRGKYVCEECGIRCKKPSMLKKHIRTHTDVRPFTCKHCNFSFKTKGNLTKHMKSKAHHKKCIELGIDPVPVSIDEAHIDEEALAKQERYEKEFGQFADDDDTDEDFDDDEDEDDNEDDEEDEDDDDDDDDDSFDEDSDEKSVIIQPQIIRPKGQFEDAAESVSGTKSHSLTKPEDHQLKAADCPAEHEAARSLLDLSNHGKPSHPLKLEQMQMDKDDDLVIIGERPRVLMTPAECKAPLSSASGCETEELIGNPRVAWQTSSTRTVSDRGTIGDSSVTTPAAMNREGLSSEHHSTMSYAVYMLPPDRQKHAGGDGNHFEETLSKPISPVPDGSPCTELDTLSKSGGISRYPLVAGNIEEDTVYVKPREGHTANSASSDYPITEPIITLTVDDEPDKVQVSGPDFEQPMDLSVASARVSDSPLAHHSDSPFAYVEEEGRVTRDKVDVEDSYVIKKRRLLAAKEIDNSPPRLNEPQPKSDDLYEAITPPPTDVDATLDDQSDYEPANLPQTFRLNGGRASSLSECAQRWDLDLPENENSSLLHAYLTETDGENKMLPGIVMSYHQGPDPRLSPSHSKLGTFTLRASPVPSTSKYSYLPSSANSFHSPSPRAQSASPHDADVSGKHQSEFLLPSDCKTPTFSHRSMDDGKCVCNICNKSFTKPSQLRLHVNIHYFERPFRCDSCAVSFRTKGHLQKHRRSVSHYNKVNMNMTFGTPTTDNPRPFKCGDCKIAFRIHGHLAKHLRSKMHIMKLECLGKLPFGTYAEIERSGVNLNEIDTTDCENSLESLQVMAQRMYEKDPRRQHWTRERTISGCSADDGSDVSHVTDDSVEGGRYRSLSLGDTGRLTPEYRDMDEVLGNGGPGLSEVKQEPSDVHSSGELFHQKRWDVMHHSSMESLGQEYEDISDAESEPEPTTSCTYCGQTFRSVKALHLHVYVEHPEGRELPPEAPPHLENNKSLPQSRVHCPMRVRSMSMSDNPALSMEVRTGSFPGEMSVAMEMRRNMFADGAAIAMEIRRNSGNFITEISATECHSIPHDSISGLESRRAPSHPPGLAPIVEHCPNNVADVGVVMPSRKVNNIPERVDCGMLVSVSADDEEVVDHNLPHLATVPSETSIHVHALPDSDATHISCDLCEKNFSSHSSLKQHMINHVQLRPFICEVCDAGFTSKEYLWHHHQTHNREKESINQDDDNVPNCKENHHSHPLSTYCVRAEEDTVR